MVLRKSNEKKPSPLPLLFERAPQFPRGLAPFLKEVGRGKRGAKDLTHEEAKGAVSCILDGEATPAQIGALFQAYRIKAETPEELAGMIEAIRERSKKAIQPSGANKIEVGLPYDGRKRAFHALPFAALLAARAGVQTFFHGDVAVGPKFGVNAVEILHALGVASSESPEGTDRDLAERGVAYCLQAAYSPAMKRLRPLRDEVILRGPLATAEKMLNLSAARCLIVGVTHTPYAPVMARALGLMLGGWGAERAWVVQGAEGHIDLDPRRANSLQRVSAGGEPEAVSVRPSASLFEGLEKRDWVAPAPPEADLLDREGRRRWIEANVRWGRAALEGEEKRGRPALECATALLLLAAGFCEDIDSGIVHARELAAQGGRSEPKRPIDSEE